jgi:3-hydroxyacyl-CoA dehydrogenase
MNSVVVTDKSVATISVEDGIGVVSIDSPPVNALGAVVRQSLNDSFHQLANDAAVKAIVLICEGRTFFAGADISEFGRPIQEPRLATIFDLIENMSKPVLAAIHGTGLGGGLELALVCHYRVAERTAKVGLPEVKLGILPGAGGTQRLPRIVGIEDALELITSGRQIGAAEAQRLGLIDALAEPGALRTTAIQFARQVVADGRPLTRIRDREDAIAAARGKPEIFSDFRTKNSRLFRGFRAPEAIVKAVEAAVNLPFEAGIARERELLGELVASVESQAQRYMFFAERETTKIPDVPSDTPVRPVKSVGVIGAGTMGGGIAMTFLNVGIPVTLVETSQAALDRGLGVIRSNYENTAKKGRMSVSQIEERMELITPALGLDALSEVDLVIEAVFESMSVKKEIFSKLDQIARPGAILASNTSFLDLDEIAEATTRPEDVIGLHYFSPANVMRLLEVVRGEKTAPDVIATAMKLAKQTGKQPILARVCSGFVANRLMSPRSRQAEALVLEGPTPSDIDRVMVEYGFAMGPFQMADLVGLDVLGRNDSIRTLRGDLVAKDRLGQKKNGGYYDYDERRKPQPSPVAAQLIAEFAAAQGVQNRGVQTDEDIRARLLFPIVNEGARILEEKIALRASDIDVAAVLGYNWPAYTGGPMFWADTIGLPLIVANLRAFQDQYGDTFKPAALLEQLAKDGKSFTRK